MQQNRLIQPHPAHRYLAVMPNAVFSLDDTAPPLHLRAQDKSLREMAARLVIGSGKGQHPSPATVMRLLRDHDDKAAVAAAAG
jgi:hypothetical protein